MHISQINNENTIYFNFTYYALKLLGKNLYSNPWTAVSELVANGLDAGAKSIYVLIDMRQKNEAQIEIFDNGSGMSYDDLSSKYAIIGRNKRNDISDDSKSLMMGRKGIGKLAALYLSKKYFISTKQSNTESIWMIDSTKFEDNDIPCLERVENIDFISHELWNSFSSGTMIKLTNVDLKNIGEEKVKSLKAILADYYLYNKINTKIFVSVINRDNDKIVFSEVKKEVYFSTMFAMFDNSEMDYFRNLKDKVYLTKEVQPSYLDKPRDTVILGKNDFPNILDGQIQIEDESGKIKVKNYALKGWIGIHASIDETIQKRNDPNYKKLLYRGNSLRLYVRNKLAVENFIKYIGTTQAFSPYIEGEISFDILDDDDLEDISTSSREAYPLNDIRVKKLINIVYEIVRRLMKKRAEIGSQINDEIENFRINEKREALLRERNAYNEALKERTKREHIENENRKVIKELEDKSLENKNIKSRLFNLEKNFTKDGESYKHGLHLSVNFAREIQGNIMDLNVLEKAFPQDVVETLMDIDRTADKIVKLPKTIEQSSFSLNSKYIKEDLVDYITQYCEVRNSKSFSIEVENLTNGYILEFDFSDIIMVIDNIISNSKNFNATKLKVKIYNSKGFIIFDFINNGEKLNKKYENNTNMVFELGETSTEGFGIGCYHIKKIIEMMRGHVSILNNTKEEGVTLRVVFGDGKI